MTFTGYFAVSGNTGIVPKGNALKDISILGSFNIVVLSDVSGIVMQTEMHLYLTCGAFPR